MPRQQVYGKHSRALYDPFAIFESPPTQATEDSCQSLKTQASPKLTGICVQAKTRDYTRDRSRRVLGEISGNNTPHQSEEPRKSPKQRLRKQRLVEQEKDATAEREHALVQDSASHFKVHGTTADHTEAALPEDKNDVPLFVDDHGYDTDEEAEHGSVTIAQTERDFRDITDPYEVHCSELLSLSTTNITSFCSWTAELTSQFTLTKIAEASFGEVYRLSLLPAGSTGHSLLSFTRNDESVFKIIPLQQPLCTLPPPSRKRARAAAEKQRACMSSSQDVATEVKVLQGMSSIPGFSNFRDVRVVRGRPTQLFASAYKAFNSSQKALGKEPSIFPDPAKKASYAEDQLWAVIEMQDAGIDLERRVEAGECTSIWATWDVFWQVVLTLAKGEEGAEFEHRDLHLGNICVKWLAGTPSSDHEHSVDVTRKLHFTGAETTLIDYTFSRALLPSTPTDSNTDDLICIDLAQPQHSSLFDGDSTEEYQYDIYRYMRGVVLHDDAYADVSSLPSSSCVKSHGWQDFHPVTNTLWLHYILYKLLEQLHWPSASRAPGRKAQPEAYARWRRARELEGVLLRVQEMLDPGKICTLEGVSSAKELVGMALAQGWIGVEDVVGDGTDIEVKEEKEEDEDEEGSGRLVEVFENLRIG